MKALEDMVTKRDFNILLKIVPVLVYNPDFQQKYFNTSDHCAIIHILFGYIDTFFDTH